jgi:hypothetical protein
MSPVISTEQSYLTILTITVQPINNRQTPLGTRIESTLFNILILARIGDTWGTINFSEDYLRYRAQLGYALLLDPHSFELSFELISFVGV